MPLLITTVQDVVYVDMYVKTEHFLLHRQIVSDQQRGGQLPCSCTNVHVTVRHISVTNSCIAS